MNAGLANGSEADLTVAALAEAFTHEWDYDRLGELCDRLLQVAPEADLPEQGRLLLGAILNRRHAWYEAADVYARAANDFPDSFTAPYEAALNGIDAGRYDMAIEHLKGLGLRLDRLPDRNLRGVWRAAAAVGLHTLSRQAFDMAKARRSSLVTPEVSHRIDRALAAQDRRWAPIVSVGENCLPWQLINRWGLRHHPADIGQQSIFNLGQTNCGAVAALIRSRGEGLTDSANLRVARQPGSGPRPLNERFGYDFNHEQGEPWIADDYARLKARYAERITAFRARFSGEKRVFLLYSEYEGDLNGVIDALTEVNTDDHFVVVIIDVRSEDRAQPPRPHPKVAYARLRLPRTDYLWYRPDDHDSPEGVYFEQAIRDLVAVHADLGPLEPSPPVAEKPKGWRLFGR